MRRVCAAVIFLLWTASAHHPEQGKRWVILEVFHVDLCADAGTLVKCPDATGDGLGEIAVQCPGSGGQVTEWMVLDGRTGGVLKEAPALDFESLAQEERGQLPETIMDPAWCPSFSFGAAFAEVDLDRDGQAEFVVTDPDYETAGTISGKIIGWDRGALHVFGSDGELLATRMGSTVKSMLGWSLVVLDGHTVDGATRVVCDDFVRWAGVGELKRRLLFLDIVKLETARSVRVERVEPGLWGRDVRDAHSCALIVQDIEELEARHGRDFFRVGPGGRSPAFAWRADVSKDHPEVHLYARLPFEDTHAAAIAEKGVGALSDDVFARWSEIAGSGVFDGYLIDACEGPLIRCPEAQVVARAVVGESSLLVMSLSLLGDWYHGDVGRVASEDEDMFWPLVDGVYVCASELQDDWGAVMSRIDDLGHCLRGVPLPIVVDCSSSEHTQERPIGQNRVLFFRNL